MSTYVDNTVLKLQVAHWMWSAIALYPLCSPLVADATEMLGRERGQSCRFCKFTCHDDSTCSSIKLEEDIVVINLRTDRLTPVSRALPSSYDAHQLRLGLLDLADQPARMNGIVHSRFQEFQILGHPLCFFFITWVGGIEVGL
jgi:hypothetical protein